jgi:hypothetical protein
MKNLKAITFTLMTMFSLNALATVDAMTEAWIVVEDFNASESDGEARFFPQKVPVVGCYGLPQGPQSVQFVSEFKIKSTMGCGDSSTDMVDINALSCAEMTDSVENDDFMSFKKIVLDISKCAHKNNKNFITMVRTAAARNFPQSRKGKYISKPDVELILVK